MGPAGPKESSRTDPDRGEKAYGERVCLALANLRGHILDLYTSVGAAASVSTARSPAA